jgi:nitroreductase/NAD-dependent dihydropyrimidine dehydrogenase PreA subunit
MREIDVPAISIDAEACKGDGLCARLCPMRIFSDGNPPEVRRPEECVLCGQCLAGCPGDAIRHSGFPADRMDRIVRQDVSPEAALTLLSRRRSVREYRPEPPPRQLIDRILAVAGHAPGSPHHRVGWTRHFTVVAGEETMKQVRELTVAYMRKIHKLLTGVVLRTCARFSEAARAGVGVAPDLAMRLAEWSQGRDLVTWQAPVAIFAHAPMASSCPQADCDAALYSVLLLAHAHGLGTCWNGLLQGAAAGDHLRGWSSLHDFLQIPPGHRCYAAATMGYPVLRLHSVPRRDVAVHWIGA